MLGSISPVGEATRGQRWWLTATAYVAASAGAGALLGSALGGAGALLLGPMARAAPAPASPGLPAAVRLGALGALIVAAALVDAGIVGHGVPSWRRQVDERWLTTYRGWVYGAGFGAQLGLGVATIVTSASTYTAFAAALLGGSWRSGLLIGATFGVVRTVPLLAMAPVRTADRLYAVTRRVAHAAPTAHRVTVAGQGVIAAVVLLTAVVR